MCTHFRSYLRGAQDTLRTDHSLLRWLQKFWNSDGMLACWYMLSVTFEYRPWVQHANADGLSRQCGQCLRPGCPVSSAEAQLSELSELLDQPFASLAMGDSMDADLLPELHPGLTRHRHSAQMGPSCIGAIVVGVFRVISGVKVLAITVRKLVSQYGWLTVAPPGSSVDDFPTGGASQ